MKTPKVFLLIIAMVAVSAISYYLPTLVENISEESSSAGTGTVEVHAMDMGNGSNLTKSDMNGDVGIYTTLLPEQSNQHQLIFEVVMNSTSVDLQQYDLTENAAISFGTKNDRTGTFEWEPTSKENHHIIGYLKWSGSFDKSYKNIKLELKNIDYISSRSFTWKNSKSINQILNH